MLAAATARRGPLPFDDEDVRRRVDATGNGASNAGFGRVILGRFLGNAEVGIGHLLNRLKAVWGRQPRCRPGALTDGGDQVPAPPGAAAG